MDFINDEEKMRDFYELSKEEFLNSYSYLTENDYEATIKALMIQMKFLNLKIKIGMEQLMKSLEIMII